MFLFWVRLFLLVEFSVLVGYEGAMIIIHLHLCAIQWELKLYQFLCLSFWGQKYSWQVRHISFFFPIEFSFALKVVSLLIFSYFLPTLSFRSIHFLHTFVYCLDYAASMTWIFLIFTYFFFISVNGIFYHVPRSAENQSCSSFQELSSYYPLPWVG